VIYFKTRIHKTLSLQTQTKSKRFKVIFACSKRNLTVSWAWKSCDWRDLLVSLSSITEIRKVALSAGIQNFATAIFALPLSLSPSLYLSLSLSLSCSLSLPRLYWRTTVCRKEQRAAAVKEMGSIPDSNFVLLSQWVAAVGLNRLAIRKCHNYKN
jgi:hypothetical protein